MRSRGPSRLTAGAVDVRRIARNTGWLSLRLVLSTAANLMAVRLVVRALGISGFGVFSAVVGVLEVAFFLRWTLEVSVRRFLCHAFAHDDRGAWRRTFSSGCILAFFLSLVFAGLAETAGSWFLDSKIDISPDVRASTSTFFHVGVVWMVLEALRMPWSALVVSVERMDFLTKVEVLESALSLLAAGAVGLVGPSGLVFYGVLLLLKSAVVLAVFLVYCKRCFPDRVGFCPIGVRDVAEQASFFAKGLLTDVANLLKYHGVNLLLSVYAGTAYNASWNAAMKIGNGLYGLVGGFQEAVFPQIVRSWAQEDRHPFVALLAYAVRWSAILVGVCVLPLLFFTRTVLELWLGQELPPEAVAFARCVGVHFLFDALSAPLRTAVFATGRILRYQMAVSVAMGFGFVLAWCFLSSGFPAWTSVGAVALSNVLAFAYRLWYVQRHLGVSGSALLRRAFLPGFGRMV